MTKRHLSTADTPQTTAAAGSGLPLTKAGAMV